MTGEKFAEIVTKRANERVQIKLREFKRAVEQAFEKLSGTRWVTEEDVNNPARTGNYIILKKMLEKEDISFSNGWPGILWKKEEKAVADELLSMMDEMQKALLSPGPKEGDCKPEETT